jgi:hypothetical protein
MRFLRVEAPYHIRTLIIKKKQMWFWEIQIRKNFFIDSITINCLVSILRFFSHKDSLIHGEYLQYWSEFVV